MIDEINPKLIGGIGSINFGKQYRQGNRVYDSDNIAMAVTAQPLGNLGGYSYLYLVKAMERKPIQLGFMDNGTGQHQSNTVYSCDGISPCISTLGSGCSCGGTQQIKVLVNGSNSNRSDG